MTRDANSSDSTNCFEWTQRHLNLLKLPCLLEGGLVGEGYTLADDIEQKFSTCTTDSRRYIHHCGGVNKYL